MKVTRRHWLLLSGAVAAAIGCWLSMRDASSSQENIKSMQAFTDRLQTFCVGRFLIEAPASVEDASGTYETQIASVEARPSPYKSAQSVLQALDVQLQLREAELRSQPPSPRGSSRFLGISASGSAVRVLRYLTPGAEPDGKAAGYVAREGGIFEFQTNASVQTRVTELLQYLVEVESSLAILSPGQIPSTPGFCIGNGLIATNPKRGENVNGWAWTLPGHPEATFGISTSTNDDVVRPGLLDREASILRETAAWLQHVKTLRKRRFDLNGMPAQEWLVELTDDAPEYHFDIEIPGLPNDNARPFIKLKMTVGGSGRNGHVKPSLSVGEALALWDALIQTLRLRPGAI